MHKYPSIGKGTKIVTILSMQQDVCKPTLYGVLVEAQLGDDILWNVCLNHFLGATLCRLQHAVELLRVKLLQHFQ